jgi:hypothetical protein
MHPMPPDFGYIVLEEFDDCVMASLDNANYFDFIVFLEENNFEFEEFNEYRIKIYDPLDEIQEEFIEYDVVVYLTENSPDETIVLTEGSAKRKIVIRKGKRKVIFQCPPGQKKIGRRCAKRPSAEIQKLKRRAKRAARKGKSKRKSAIRKRKISLKRRQSIDHKQKKQEEKPKKK